jgi:hypothetical protein
VADFLEKRLFPLDLVIGIPTASGLPTLPESEVAFAEPFEGSPIGSDDIGIDRLSRRNEPGIVFSKTSRRPPLQRGTSPGMRQVESLNRETLKRRERGGFVGRALEQFFDGDDGHDDRTPPQRRQEAAHITKWPV